MDGLTEADYKALAEICPGGMFRNVELAKISQWRIGGRADVILRPNSGEQVSALRRWFNERSIRHVVIGLTSNLLFADEGLHVPCIQIGQRMSGIQVRGNEVIAQAGVWVPVFARRMMQAGLTGAEHICGIPGTLGGLGCMNGGSQRKNIASNVLSVKSVDVSGCLVERSREECKFAYRKSIYQTNDEIIAEVKLHFESAEQSKVRSAMLSILKDRRSKFPRKEANCGSVFKSNPAMYEDVGPPGRVIERLGLKGYRVGNALVSLQHANFFIASGRTKAVDMLQLISEIRYAVYATTGHLMETEVQFVTEDGMIVPM